MTTCYAQLRLKGLSDFSNFSFTALFISQDTGRKFETDKLKIHSTGISVEAQFPLKKMKMQKIVVYGLMFICRQDVYSNLNHLWG